MLRATVGTSGTGGAPYQPMTAADEAPGLHAFGSRTPRAYTSVFQSSISTAFRGSPAGTGLPRSTAAVQFASAVRASFWRLVSLVLVAVLHGPSAGVTTRVPK